MTDQTVADVLNSAADGLERDGWMNPECASDGPNPTCAQVAIGRVGAAREILNGAERALWTHIGGASLGDIWSWNDNPRRTATEVIETLRAAALIAAAADAPVLHPEARPELEPVSP